jgi:NAD(P)-dependent dehydrogenase (short-subunit alcohol dehydrogenase family)
LFQAKRDAPRQKRRTLPDEQRHDNQDARFVGGHVSEPDQIRAMVDAVEEEYGRLDVAVNNAGTPGTYKAFSDQLLDDWQRTLAVNLTGVFLSMQAEIPAMLDVGRGAIVNVASAAGLMGFANLPAYVASKHGVIGLTKSVALSTPARTSASTGLPRQRPHADAPGLRRRGREDAGGHGEGDADGSVGHAGRDRRVDRVALLGRRLLRHRARAGGRRRRARDLTRPHRTGSTGSTDRIGSNPDRTGD